MFTLEMLIPFTHLTYELCDAPVKVMERLMLHVDESKITWRDEIFNAYFSPGSGKPWQGKIDHEKSKFSVEESPYLGKATYRVVVNGRFEDRSSCTNAYIDIGPDLRSLCWISMLYVVSSFLLIDSLINFHFSYTFGFSLLIGTYAIYGTYITLKKIKSAEEKFDRFFS